MSNQPVDQSRRTWVTMACAAGGVGGEDPGLGRGPRMVHLPRPRDPDDPALVERYNDVVPVIAVGDHVVAHAPIDFTTLREALASALG